MSIINQRYLENDYLEHNPSWDIKDSPWKAERIIKLLDKHKLTPKKICEIGCGAGRILAELYQWKPTMLLHGYDIAPGAKRFWAEIENDHMQFTLGDFFIAELSIKQNYYDLIMLLDVLEHVESPQQFLSDLHGRSDYILLHFPLDLSAFSIIREQPLLYVRRKVGHIHYFTKGLALELLHETGWEVLDSVYSGATFSSPQATLKTKVASIFRKLIYAMHKDIGVRVLGGETLFVLARSA